MRKNHISVCICTFRRAALLQKLLERLRDQRTDGQFTYSAVVADNDAGRSAEKVVADFSPSAPFSITYCVEPQQNIALVRNKALQQSDSDYIAFIDDDEFPGDDWLFNLFHTQISLGVDGVLGPVKPYFETEPPAWAKRGRFFERPTHPTGFKMSWSEARTGNVLFSRSILEGVDGPFRSVFDTAGEDVDFFRRMMEKGCRFVWCDEASVYELVPASRCTRTYLLRRALLRGSNFSKHPTHRVSNGVKSLIAVPVYALSLPFLLLFGQHVFLRYLIKFLDHFSRLMAYLGFRLVTERHT